MLNVKYMLVNSRFGDAGSHFESKQSALLGRFSVSESGFRFPQSNSESETGFGNRFPIVTNRTRPYRFPQRHSAITWYVKTFRNVNYVC